MKRALPVTLVLALGCVGPEATTRTERGPLLRSFHRQEIVEGGLAADVRVDWPTLKLTLSEWDTCRDLELDEYAEERITERAVAGAGPALSTGLTATLAGLAAFGISFALSDSPDVTHLNQAGNYGPSTRTLVRGWSYVGIGFGVPALIVGVVNTLRGGETVEHRRVEQPTAQHDSRCKERPVTGAVTLLAEGSAAGTLQVADGALDLDAARAPVGLDGFGWFGRKVELDDAATARLAAFSACVRVNAPVELKSLGEQALLSRRDALTACKAVRPDVPGLDAVNEEVGKRQQSGSPGAFSPRPDAASFEEAVAAWNPRLRLKAGSADLARLETPAALEGQAALLEGIVSDGMTQNIGVVQVGDRELFVFLPPKRAWGYEFGNGTRVEAVVVLAGQQTVGAKTLPLVRAVWMRPAFQ